MAANINSMASVREVPWHGLGTVLDKPVSPEAFQELSGLNWTVSKRNLNAGGIEIPDYVGIFRDDTNTPLGIVSDAYTSVQNSEMFSFAKALSEFDTELFIDTAGALGKGEIVWSLLKMPSLAHVMGNDVIYPYLLLINGHIGTRRFSIFPTTVRVVCQNTMRMAEGNRTNKRAKKGFETLSTGWDLKHCSGINDRIAEAKIAISKSIMDWEATKIAITRLAEKKADDELLESIISNVFSKDEDANEKTNKETIAKNRRDQIFANWNSPTSKGISTEGTVWTALNAVTEFLDHQSTLRPRNYSEGEARFIASNLGGSAEKKKVATWDFAMSLV